MKIGDLVKINDVANDPRGSGVILKFDVYTSGRIGTVPMGFPDQEAVKAGLDRLTIRSTPSEQIAEVLWADGSLGWILSTRLTVDIYGTRVQIHSS